jgi:hypothetical protein
MCWKSHTGASTKATDVPSFAVTVHQKTLIATYFAIVAKDGVHVYLDNQSILDFLRREA